MGGLSSRPVFKHRDGVFAPDMMELGDLSSLRQVLWIDEVVLGGF